MSVVTKEFCPITCNVGEAITFFPFPLTQFGYSLSGTAETVSCLTSFALPPSPIQQKEGEEGSVLHSLPWGASHCLLEAR